VLGAEGLKALSRLTIDITLPILIFCQLIKEFRFDLYPNWWIFPLLSLAITLLGWLAGLPFARLISGDEKRLQFLNLTSFQNSGYLPLALIAALLPASLAGEMFIYLFLFLLGFNLLMFSVGAHTICCYRRKQFEMASLFSPPVIAVLFSLVAVFFGLPKFVPEALYKPLRMVGDCTLPLAMFVVGGNLAEISLQKIDKKSLFFLILVKMVILPLIGLAVIFAFSLPRLISLLVLIQLAMPSATTLSVLVRHYKKEDLLISQGILFTHLASVVSIPVFLIIYFRFFMLQ
jgi:predicted permease